MTIKTQMEANTEVRFSVGASPLVHSVLRLKSLMENIDILENMLSDKKKQFQDTLAVHYRTLYTKYWPHFTNPPPAVDTTEQFLKAASAKPNTTPTTAMFQQLKVAFDTAYQVLSNVYDQQRSTFFSLCRQEEKKE